MGELSRRAFLKLAAGGSAAAAAGFGVKPLHRLISHIEPPKDAVPGEVTVYATTCRECPAGCGMHAWNRDGRVVKVEGNPDHPISHGGLCARGQSALQGLYDPDRLRHVLYRPRLAMAATVPATSSPATGPATAGSTPVFGPAQKSDWRTAITEIANRLKVPGANAYILSDLQTGALAEIMTAFASAFDNYGRAKPSFTEPFDYGPLRESNEVLFNKPLIPDYRIDDAELIVSFGADFLETWVSPVQYAHRFAKMHAYDPVKKTKGRMIYIGPRLSMTAANADEFIQVRPWDMTRLALAMLVTILDRGWARGQLKWGGREVKTFQDMCWPGTGADYTLENLSKAVGVPEARVVELAESFVSRKSVALAGPIMGETYVFTGLSFLTGLLNVVAGAIGRTVDIDRPHALSKLGMDTDSWVRGNTLFVHEANIGYYDSGLLNQIRDNLRMTVVYLGTMPNETAEQADWVLPIDSPLESWGDYEPQAGIHSAMQPAMSRIYDTRAAGDIFLAIAEEAGKPLTPPGSSQPLADTRQWLLQRWDGIRQRSAPGQPLDGFWRESLRQGWRMETVPVSETPVTVESEELDSTHVPRQFPFVPMGRLPTALELELWLWPSIMLYDGRTANRSWLQEAPDPLSTVQWGSWVDVHPKTAAAHGLATGDVVEVGYFEGPGSGMEVPVRITEDVAEGTVALAFGQGHTAMGRNAAGRGVNVFGRWNSSGTETFGSVNLRPTGRRAEIIFATATEDQHGREILQWAPLSNLREMKQGDRAAQVGLAGSTAEGEEETFSLPLPEGYDKDKDLYTPRVYKDHRWAMVVDLDRCIGCGACAVACQAENNVAVVGPVEAAKGRTMNWLRVVPYRHPEDPRKVGFLPIFCQHCDSAPCEPVCPVFASVHNEEGLNAQVYNRCIGTRYCSHNCPYKVRRFNWFDHEWERPLNWQLNPEVTVRCRGVMEKCTFCIQRIRAGEWAARREGRAVRDGEIQPACGQSCPTKAISFGDLLDPESQVSRLTRGNPRRYHILEDLNTKPAVTYLRRIEGDK